MAKTRHQQKMSKKKKAMYKLMKGGMFDEKKVILFGIDMQVDFHEEGGKLPVTGAIADTDRIIKMLETHGNKIDEVHLTLDSHTPVHIAHENFWVKKDTSEHPEPNTELTLDGETIVGKLNNAEVGIYVPENLALLNYAKAYIKALADKKGPHLIIWPTHCIVTEDESVAPAPANSTQRDGWNIRQKLCDALKIWKGKNAARKIYLHEKGTNNYSEMYSVFEAEVPYEDLLEHVPEDLKYKDTSEPEIKEYEIPPDGTFKRPKDKAFNFSTRFNESLFQSITGDPNSIILVCGEAKSHCVRSSVEHMVKKIDEKQNFPLGQIYLLNDAMSNVFLNFEPLDTFFKDLGDKFITTMKEKGLTITTTDKAFDVMAMNTLPFSAGGKKKKSLKQKRRSHKKK